MIISKYILKNLYNKEYIANWNWLDEDPIFETSGEMTLAYIFNDKYEVEEFLKIFRNYNFVIEEIVTYEDSLEGF